MGGAQKVCGFPEASESNEVGDRQAGKGTMAKANKPGAPQSTALNRRPKKRQQASHERCTWRRFCGLQRDGMT